MRIFHFDVDEKKLTKRMYVGLVYKSIKFNKICIEMEGTHASAKHRNTRDKMKAAKNEAMKMMGDDDAITRRRYFKWLNGSGPSVG